MKKLIIILAAAAMTGCGIYKPYTRPEVKTDGLYGTAETADTTTIGNLGWEEMFTDPYLRTLIRQGLENNTDLQSAQWRVKEAEATLKSARLAYLPSFNFAPQGSLRSPPIRTALRSSPRDGYRVCKCRSRSAPPRRI